MSLDVEAIFHEIGDFGPYQRRIFFLLCLPAILNAAANMAHLFTAGTPHYRCFVQDCDLNITARNIYDSSFINYTIPLNDIDRKPATCSRFKRKSSKSYRKSCLPEDFTNETEACFNGYVFDNSTFHSTIVTEFNLTCSSDWEIKAAQSVFFGGILVGSFLFGFISDLIGRKATIMIGIVGTTSTGITIALIPNLLGFNIFRFFNAMMNTAIFQTAFVLGMEFVGTRWRVMMGVMGQYFFALGEVLLGLIAWGLQDKDWRMLQLVVSVPTTCFIFYYWFIPESVRWLISKGKTKKAICILEKVAKGNGVSIPQHFFNTQNEENLQAREVNIANDEISLISSPQTISSPQNLTMAHILCSPVLCVRMLSMFIVWIVTTLVYYGISLNSTNLGGPDSADKPFKDFILSSLVEIPGYTLAWLGMSQWGRKGSQIASLILGGAACILAGYALETKIMNELIPALVGKCFITCAFAIIYVYTTEMFPTSVRNTILGLCSTFARIGGMMAPFSESLSSIYVPLPMLMFGGASVFAGILSLIMPETLNTKLPDTLDEAINLGRNLELSLEVVESTEESQALLNENEDDEPEPVST
ncbi:unnamed protein product [Meganyctiphanes norvegica]|uniref:Major facilitator superfamily (MFS) profile domain-containing protein n=1 Tax=Meganyctiphanes norvegica TaxID=48144 RepID=A0AAV2Q8N9_MEGNR